MIYELKTFIHAEKMEYLWNEKCWLNGFDTKVAILARIFWLNALGGKLSSQNIHSLTHRKQRKETIYNRKKKLKRHPYCHVHNLSKHWARDFAWIMLNLAEFSISIYLAIRPYATWNDTRYIYGENEHRTLCNDNMGNEVNLWRCIPQMKFHFMNEFTNSTHTHTLTYYICIQQTQNLSK